MTIIPLGPNILLEPVTPEQKTASGLIIAASEKKPDMAKVLAAGPLADIEPGTTVIFKPYGAQEVQIDEKKLLMVEEEDVLAIVE